MTLIGALQHAMFAAHVGGAYHALERHCQTMKVLKLWDPNRQEGAGWCHETTSCPICWGKFASRSKGSDQRPLCRLQCGHVFDKTCIEKWLSSGDTSKCPLCQQVIATSDTPFRLIVLCRALWLAAHASFASSLLYGCLEAMEAFSEYSIGPRLGLFALAAMGNYFCGIIALITSLVFTKHLFSKNWLRNYFVVLILTSVACGVALVGCFHQGQQIMERLGVDWLYIAFNCILWASLQHLADYLVVEFLMQQLEGIAIVIVALLAKILKLGFKLAKPFLAS